MRNLIHAIIDKCRIHEQIKLLFTEYDNNFSGNQKTGEIGQSQNIMLLKTEHTLSKYKNFLV